MSLTGLGGRLRAAREQKGLLPSKVAESLECDVRTIYRWERGEFEPSIAALARLAELYGVTPNYLVMGTD